MGLTIRDLGDSIGSRSSGCGSLRLTITDLRSRTGALVDSLDVDGHALCALSVGVQVIESAGQALEEGGGACSTGTLGQGKGVVAAESEAISLEGTGLYGLVKLEPVDS